MKQCLEIQQRRFETDLIGLKEKKEQSAAASAGEKKTNAPIVASANRTYTKEISLYGRHRSLHSHALHLADHLAWDQSDKFIKIYVQNMDGVGDLPAEKVRCSFEER